MHTIQFLFSTVDDNLFLKNKEVLKDLTNFLVINQTKHSRFPSSPNTYCYAETGLSKSRNQALKLATGDICYICDDDIKITKPSENIIIQAFNETPQADVILFPIMDDHGHPRRQLKPGKKASWATLLGSSSIEIAFKLQSIRNAQIFFDEKFGLGSKYESSEETIFLFECLNHGLKIFSHPQPVVYHPKESSGSSYLTHKKIEDKGAVLARLFGPMAFVFALPFTAKQRPHFSKNFSITKFFMYLIKGIYKYRNSYK